MPLALTPRTAFALEIFATDGRRHFAYHEHVYALLEDEVERLTVLARSAESFCRPVILRPCLAPAAVA
jgi:hypothetical protein